MASSMWPGRVQPDRQRYGLAQLEPWPEPFAQLLDEGLDAFACPSGNFHNRAANGFSKDFRIEDISVSPRDVHHIDGHEDGNPQFHELCRQVEVAFKVAAINDIQDGISRSFTR